MLPLLKLEQGDKGIVRASEGGKDFETWVSELGINKDSEVEFLTHIPHETLVLEVDGKEIKVGLGKASRLWVEVEGKTIQVNHLEKGKRAKVSKVVGGARHQEEMEELGIREGAEITVVEKEPSGALPQRKGNYVLARIGDRMVSIGRGMAGKVWVD